MGSLRSQAQFEQSHWRLRLLGPLWCLQLALTFTMAGLFAYRIGDTLHSYEDRKAPQLEVVWESTNVGLSFLASICTMVEIARYLAESLTPWTVLFTHTIKLTCAACLLALDIVAHIKVIDENFSIVGLALDAAFMLTTSALAIYALVTYRRLSSRDAAHRVDIKGYGFSDGLGRDSSYSGPRPTLEKRISSVSSRLSFGSMRQPHPEPQTDGVVLETMSRTPSLYSHERDTRFDDFVKGKRRESLGNSEDIERGISPLQEVEDGRQLTRPRASSWVDEHVLVSVPEEAEEHVGAKSEEDKKDREALLDDNRRGSEDDEQPHRVLHEVDIAEPRWKREQ
ncbi:uncharacterized protein F5Z01DRAFT_639604 [Emericellopsis atlantica]|uniref:Uncharacterized protein n=1 Tax=Emericellopsis atlantica TaxID=2614577 RepID=A0A9P8CMZ4_9HYPO|nr:uncharacterized protein F5Z01DRAFT_639604 [Emericellopsis atlantica]KAG9251206.1 hypothetical protein F5Z01DRAFT_639604 [Emericellopsis atlantica]